MDPLLSEFKAHALHEVHRYGAAIGEGVKPFHDELEAIGNYFDRLPALLLVIGHSLFVAGIFREGQYRHYWALSLICSFAGAFGGGTITSWLLFEHPSWMTEDWIAITYCICWYLNTYCPGDLVYRLYKLTPCKALCKAASMVIKARSITKKADQAQLVFGAGSVVAPLLFGTVAGCGGSLLADVAAKAFDSKKPTELSSPTWVLRSSFFMTFLYLGSSHWLPILPHHLAVALIMSLLVAQALAAELTGKPCDFTAPFQVLFHSLTGIPYPPQALPPPPKKAVVFQKSTESKKSK